MATEPMLYEAGARLAIVSNRKYDVVMHNDVGGTEDAPRGSYVVIVERSWFDYETGNHYAAVVTSQHEMNALAAAGRTPHSPKVAGWDPSQVFFCQDSIRFRFVAGAWAYVGGR